MYYEINVSKVSGKDYKNDLIYKHFFATAPKSIRTKAELKEALEIFMMVFPEPMFGISVSLDNEQRESVYISEILNNNLQPIITLDIKPKKCTAKKGEHPCTIWGCPWCKDCALYK